MDPTGELLSQFSQSNIAKTSTIWPSSTVSYKQAQSEDPKSLSQDELDFIIYKEASAREFRKHQEKSARRLKEHQENSRREFASFVE